MPPLQLFRLRQRCLLAMLQVSSHVSDLIFSPGSHPHVEVSGQLVPVKMPGMPVLSPGDTHRIAQELIGDNKQAHCDAAEPGIVRHFLQPAGHGAFSRQCFRAARQPRHRDAGDSQEHSYF